MADEPATPDELYALAPGAFVAARDTMARRLRAEGDRDAAAALATRRRPPATAWALNQVARLAPDLIAAVLTEGERLQSAVDQALAGDRTALRAAQAAERDAVEAVTDAAADHLRVHGPKPTDAVLRRVADTLRGAILDPEIADLLRRGILDRDVDAPGFGLGAATAPASREHRAAAAKPGPEGRPTERPEERKAKRRQAELAADVARLQRRAARLRSLAADAQRRAADAAAEADAAEADAGDAARRLSDDGR